jgi:thiol-disulfide isomerase/thioredoxin
MCILMFSIFYVVKKEDLTFLWDTLMFFCLFLRMIKRIIFLCTLSLLVLAVNSQQIAKWKIEDVVKSFSPNNDTVYVVNFWATFCKPCIAEIPDFIRIVDKYKTKKVKLLLVSLDLPSYYPVKIADFAKKNNYKTNIAWLNETDADRFCPMIDAKWSGAIPATIIVNNKTGYRKFVEDQISGEDFEAALKAAMGETGMNKYLAPMNDAEVIKANIVNNPQANDFISFKSADSSVYSITKGKVSAVVTIENSEVVIIMGEQMIFYTYSNLGLTTLKKGDIVKQGQLIGFAAHGFGGVKPTLDLWVSNEKGEYVMLDEDVFTARKK